LFIAVELYHFEVGQFDSCRCKLSLHEVGEEHSTGEYVQKKIKSISSAEIQDDAGVQTDIT